MLPTEVVKLPTVPAHVVVSKCAETFPPSQLSPQGAGPHLKFFSVSLSLFFLVFDLYILPYLILKRLTCFVEV